MKVNEEGRLKKQGAIHNVCLVNPVGLVSGELLLRWKNIQ